MRDLKNNIAGRHSIAPAARTATVNGSWIDTRGFGSVLAVVHCGEYTNGDFVPKLEHADADNQSDAAAVAAGDLIGAFTPLDANADDNTVQLVGYTGGKRYVRLSADEDSSPAPANGAVFGGVILLGHPSKVPTA